MSKYWIEVRYAMVFTFLFLLWMTFEKAMGWHGKHVDQHYIYTNLFAVPAILVYIRGMKERRNSYGKKGMTWKQGVKNGLIMTAFIAALSPFGQLAVHKVISPGFLENIREYSVQSGNMGKAAAARYFSLGSYLLQSFVGTLLMGTLTSLLVALFVKQKPVIDEETG